MRKYKKTTNITLSLLQTFVVLALFVTGLIALVNGENILHLPKTEPLVHPRYFYLSTPLAYGVFIILGRKFNFFSKKMERRLIPSSQHSKNSSSFFFLPGTLLGGPMFEEFIFRRVLFGFLLLETSLLPALLISTAAFAFGHLPVNSAQLKAGYWKLIVAVSGIAGIVLGWSFYLTNSLVVPFYIHLIHNFAILLTFMSNQYTPPVKVGE